MSTFDSAEVSRLLRDAREGDNGALDRLFPIVYDELRALARRQFRGQPAGHSLQPTVLVHELYLRIAERSALELKDRCHFFSLAARLMRQVLVDHYRRASASKRGGGRWRVQLPGDIATGGEDTTDVLALDEALEKLARLDPRKSRVVELRFFGGLEIDEVATALDVSPRTVQSDWFFARAWLKRELEREEE